MWKILEKARLFLLLPREVSAFEQKYLNRINRVAFCFLLAHLPIFILIGWWNQTGVLLATGLTLATLCGPCASIFLGKNPRNTSIVLGVASMFMGGILTHIGQGPVQIEMHFYFFVLIALLAAFGNPMVVLAAAATVTLHHVALWAYLPASVFNYDAPFWVLAVHATFVVLESIAACFIARSFFNNVIELEKKVAARTEEVNRRNQEMKLVLDSVEQGFMTVGQNGEISLERSAAVELLLGEIEDGDTFFDVLTRHDRRCGEQMEIGFGEVFAEFLPTELTIDQLPKRIHVSGKTLAFSFTEVRVDGQLDSLAVVVSDITADVLRERLEVESREFMVIMDWQNKDKEGFLAFMQEGQALIEQLENRDELTIEVAQRRLHTLKGSSAIQGLKRIANTCHDIEDYISATGELPDHEQWDVLFEAWQSINTKVYQMMGEHGKNVIEISRDQHAQLFENALQGCNGELAIQIASWGLEPTKVCLERIESQAQRLAQQLGRGHLKVQLGHNHLSLDSPTWSPLWSSLIHVVRNAIDHGIEPTEERIERHKPPYGQLTLTTEMAGSKFMIAISDDGRGIDWEKLTEKAYEQGLPAETREDLIAAIFSDGVSTADTVTHISGRGVGMASVREAVEQLEGRITIESEPRVGTTFRFVFPIRNMAPNLLDQLAEQNVKNPFRAVVSNDASADNPCPASIV